MRAIKLLVIPLLLLAPKAGAQSLTPSEIVNFSGGNIDFGQVSVGLYKDTLVTIQNVGCDTIWIASVTTDSPFAAIAPRSSEIDPADTITIHLKFQPPSIGDFLDSLVVTSKTGTRFVMLVNGSGTLPESVSPILNPSSIRLDEYPNPASSFVDISYDLPEPAETQILLYTMSGIKVTTLINGYQPSGNHLLKYAVHDLAVGDYICVLRTTSISGSMNSTICKFAIDK